jgi:phosphate transport system permease protein
MSEAQPTPPTPPTPPTRQPLRSSAAYNRWREVKARAFKYVALAATLFGLLMLVVFFVGLGRDVWTWFHVMPARIEEHNTRLHEEAVAITTMEADALKKIDAEMEADLRRAADDRERDKVRRQYDAARRRKLEDLETTRAEILRNEELNVRRDTSPWALLVHFFTHGPSNEPADAGILPALGGSLFVVVITILFAMPLGVGAAIYLEEYGNRNWLAHVIQVNINNLAGVPSVIYGILGAYVFVEMIFKPLESPAIAARNVFGGGMTLALLTLPVIIVSAQEALRAVPPSLRAGAHALGATRWQVIWRVVLPPALPGILTGMILSISRAIGEAAPLLLFGALMFITDTPHLFSRFTVLPMQIYGWSERPQPEWRFTAAMASAVLVILLLMLNGTAIYLRQRFSRNAKW